MSQDEPGLYVNTEELRLSDLRVTESPAYPTSKHVPQHFTHYATEFGGRYTGIL